MPSLAGAGREVRADKLVCKPDSTARITNDGLAGFKLDW